MTETQDCSGHLIERSPSSGAGDLKTTEAGVAVLRRWSSNISGTREDAVRDLLSDHDTLLSARAADQAALAAKDAEIAASQERADEWQKEHTCMTWELRRAVERAETAEAELAKVREVTGSKLCGICGGTGLYPFDPEKPVCRNCNGTGNHSAPPTPPEQTEGRS